jgi:HPt (histidine-containing phosphotransfer) domain-containing protein
MSLNAAAAEPRLDLAVIERVRELESVRPGLLQRLIEVFDRNAQQIFDALDARLAAGAVEDLRIGFHSLKGTAASLGALRLSHLAMLTEQACSDGVVDANLHPLLQQLQLEFTAVRDELRLAAANVPAGAD